MFSSDQAGSAHCAKPSPGVLRSRSILPEGLVGAQRERSHKKAVSCDMCTYVQYSGERITEWVAKN
jgi:hypothetical protein